MLELSKETLAEILKTEKLQQELYNGRQLAQILKIPPESLAAMYQHALSLFKQEKYVESLEAFLFLNFLDQDNHDIWLGLGMALQMCKKYEPAIVAYELAAIHDSESPVPFFYLAKCFFAIHDHEAALDAIEIAIQLSEDRKEFVDLLDQARNAKASLLRRQ